MPTCFSWFPQGEQLRVPYEAPQGRRVNAIGAYISHGPLAGTFTFESYARLPEPRTKKGKTPRKPLVQRAAEQGLGVDEVGVIDSGVFLSFLWRVAGRPPSTPVGWQRERPLVVVLDNYSVHHSEAIQAAHGELAAADVHLFYLPAYAPELSDIEPIWQDVKHHELVDRSHAQLGGLKRAVEAALTRKAQRLLRQPLDSLNSLRLAA